MWIALVAIAFLGIYLHRKALVDYITIKQPYTGADGQPRLRKVIRFGD